MDTDDDNDGIGDIDEYAAGTDHLDADTDDDGRFRSRKWRQVQS